MVDQNSANFSIFQGHARQRRRDFVAYGADIFQFVAPENGEVVSGQKNSKHSKKVQKQLEGG